MPRTQVKSQNILDHSLTGASFRSEFNYYDETRNYSSGDTVNWQGDVYEAVNDITPRAEGDLSEAPDVSSNWQKIVDLNNRLIISKDSTNLQNTPHGTINFKESSDAIINAVDAGNDTADVSITVKHKYMVPIWAEENAGLKAGNTEWAFGNGANTPIQDGLTVFVPNGYSCKAIAMSLTIHAGSAEVELVINGTRTGESVATDTAVSNGNATTINPITINNSDRINFRTKAASGTDNPNVATVWLEFTQL